MSLPLTLQGEERERLGNLQNADRGGVKGKVIAISVGRKLSSASDSRGRDGFYDNRLGGARRWSGNDSA